MGNSVLQVVQTTPSDSIYPPHIDQLPVEILSHIFRLLWLDTAPHPRLDIESWPRYHPVHPSIIYVTHVCRRWRDIALDTPILWSRIDDTLRSGMQTFLHRSRSVPVSLSTYLALPHQGTAAELVASVLDSCRDRLRRLDVRLHACDIFTHSRVDFAAPILECLTIQCEVYDGAAQIVDYPLLLQGQTTSLKALALLHIRHWLPANLFPNLVHLNISYFYMEELPLFMLSHLLAGCPRLETLHLGEVWSYPLVDLDLTPPAQRVHLPYLRSLSTCYATLQTASHILSCLELPQKIRIRIHNAPVDAYMTVDDNLLPPLNFMMPFTHLELAANDTTLYLVAEGEGSGVWIQAKWEGRSSSIWAEWLRHLHETLPLASIATFHVSLKDWNILPDLLSHMPALSLLGVMYLPDEVIVTHTPMLSALEAASSCLDLLSTLSIQCNSTPPLDQEDIPRILSLTTRHRLLRIILDCPDPDHHLSTVDGIEVGRSGGVCTWRMREGWDIQNEYWRLPERDEPRAVLPWSAA